MHLPCPFFVKKETVNNYLHALDFSNFCAVIQLASHAHFLTEESYMIMAFQEQVGI
jgi:hypothetical protein